MDGDVRQRWRVPLGFPDRHNAAPAGSAPVGGHGDLLLTFGCAPDGRTRCPDPFVGRGIGSRIAFVRGPHRRNLYPLLRSRWGVVCLRWRQFDPSLVVKHWGASAHIFIPRGGNFGRKVHTGRRSTGHRSPCVYKSDGRHPFVEPGYRAEDSQLRRRWLCAEDGICCRPSGHGQRPWRGAGVGCRNRPVHSFPPRYHASGDRDSRIFDADQHVRGHCRLSQWTPDYVGHFHGTDSA
jgi:hypothetical protein